MTVLHYLLFVVAVIFTSRTDVIAKNTRRDEDQAPSLPLVGSNESSESFGAKVKENQYNEANTLNHDLMPPPGNDDQFKNINQPNGLHESPKVAKITEDLIKAILDVQSGIEDSTVNIYIVPSNLDNLPSKTNSLNGLGWVDGLSYQTYQKMKERERIQKIFNSDVSNGMNYQEYNYFQSNPVNMPAEYQIVSQNVVEPKVDVVKTRFGQENQRLRRPGYQSNKWQQG